MSISASNEYSGLISFRIDCFDLFAAQGILKTLLQHYGSKASILRHSAFFTVQLTHSYMTIGKTTALTIWIFVVKVMPLVFFLFLFNFYFYFILLYNTVLVLPYFDMNPPRVYTSSHPAVCIHPYIYI